MENTEKYTNVFVEAFGISAAEAASAKYQEVQGWDSVGHMGLVATLEDTFDIEFDADDIIDFSSYEKGKEILSKYGVQF